MQVRQALLSCHTTNVLLPHHVYHLHWSGTIRAGDEDPLSTLFACTRKRDIDTSATHLCFPHHTFIRMPQTSIDSSLKPVGAYSDPEVYRYSYVDSEACEVRIAEIEPAENRDDPIKCKLTHHYLRNNPTYKTLSYTWGEDDKSKRIIVDGKYLLISRNLDAALKRLRCLDKPLYIWVDRICIDQEDILERSAQTSRMSYIYKQAKNLCVWLGEADVNSELAWELIENLVDSTDGAIAAIINDGARKNRLEALKALFRRPYWWRIWVIQEVNYGRENGREVQVFCGDRQITWTKLLKMSENMALKPIHDVLVTEYPNDPTSIYSLTGGGPLKLKLSQYSEGEKPTLMELLYTHVSKHSSDPKDKVYALVGLAGFTRIRTDYTLSIYEAYLNTAWSLISETKSLDLICVSQNDGNKYGLPSWVPDWERRSVYPNHRVMGLHIQQTFKAAGDSIAICSFSKDRKVLNTRGFVVDKIDKITNPFYMEGGDNQAKTMHTLKAFIEWWTLYSSVKGNSALSEFRRTMCGGEWHAKYDKHHHHRLEIFISLIQHFKEFQLHRFAPPELERSSMNEIPESMEEKYAAVSAASLRMHSKCLAISDGRRSCFTPRATMTGDLVCVLLGCKYPVVLRRVEEHYVLIGEVYVDGVMRGELMNDFEKTRFKAMDFNIH
jgi:hypothetical protein